MPLTQENTAVTFRLFGSARAAAWAGEVQVASGPVAEVVAALVECHQHARFVTELPPGPAPAEPDVDEGTRGGEGERGEEGEAGNANPDGKKTRGGADASAETAAREL